MDVKVEDLGKSKKKLVVTISAKEMVGHFKKAYEKIAPTIKLSGFRPGKAPRKLVEGAAGFARLLSEGLDFAISDSYYNALKNENIVPITQPKIVINKYPNYGQTEEEIKEIFEYEAELEVMPEIKIGDYSKVKVEKPKKETAKEEDVEKVLKHFQKQKSILNEVTRPAKFGDQVEISYEGFIKHIKMDAMCSKNHPLILGEKTLIPGFEEEIVGMKKGDKKEIKLKFPKDYHAKELAGKDAVFKVEILNTREVILPALDEKFAEKFGHKDMDELKKAISQSLNVEMDQNFQRELEGRVVEKLLPLLKVEIPDGLVDREVERMISDFTAQVAGQGLNFDKYLESMKKTREELASEMRPTAEKNVKVGLMLGKIVEEKKWDQNDPKIGKKALDYLVSTLTK